MFAAHDQKDGKSDNAEDEGNEDEVVIDQTTRIGAIVIVAFLCIIGRCRG